MVSKRTLTQILFVASLGVSASVAALSPQAANADETYKCGAEKLAKPGTMSPEAKAGLVKFNKFCLESKLTTKSAVGDVMKAWKKTVTKQSAKVGDVELKLDKCDSCHEKGNGSGAIKDIAYEGLPALMKAAGVK
jgi:hypothetical protein